MSQYPPPNPPAPQPHRASTPWFKRTWFLIAGTALVALIIGAAAGGAGKRKEDAERVHDTVTATATTTSVSTAPAPPAQTKTLQPTVVRTIATRTRTQTETYTPPPQPSFSDGTYQVGSDIKSGTFRTDGGDGGCYYAILKDVGSGSVDDIVDNSNFSGPSIVKLSRGQYFEVTGGCEWRHT